MQYLYQFVFYLLANRALMAGAGENGVAIFNVLQNLSYLVLYLYDGAAKAAQPLVSTYAAERNRAGSRSTLTLALATGNGLGILLCLALSLAAPAVCGVFGLTEPSAVAAGAAAVRIYCLGLVLGGTNQLLEGYDQARGLEKRSLLLATLRGAAVLLPGTATLCCISGITAPAGTSFPPPTDRKTIRVSRSSAKRPAAFFTAITRASTP